MTVRGSYRCLSTSIQLRVGKCEVRAQSPMCDGLTLQPEASSRIELYGGCREPKKLAALNSARGWSKNWCSKVIEHREVGENAITLARAALQVTVTDTQQALGRAC